MQEEFKSYLIEKLSTYTGELSLLEDSLRAITNENNSNLMSVGYELGKLSSKILQIKNDIDSVIFQVHMSNQIKNITDD